jgi:hypothetical protein
MENQPYISQSGWWCNVPIMKNMKDLVNGKDYSMCFFMENKTCLKAPTSNG